MDQTPSSEGSIERLGKPSFQRPVLGLLFAVIPALCALVYLNFFQGNNEEGAQRAIAENVLAQRGALIKYEHDRLIKNVDQALANIDGGDVERVVRQALPAAIRWQVVPLDELGIASLKPNDYGLESLVLLDRVRQTFSSGVAEFEAIRGPEGVYLALVSRFTAGDTEGVVVASFDQSVTNTWLAESPAGPFSLWQNFETSPRSLIAGPGTSERDSIDLMIAGTGWTLSIVPADTLALPRQNLRSVVWLIIFGGLSAAFWLCVVDPQRRLKSNVELILNTADSRKPLTIDISELRPLAIAIRQLTSNSRLRHKRASKQNSDEESLTTDPEVTVAEPVDAVPETPWSIEGGSWVTLPPVSLEDEALAITALARGIADLALRSSSRSFVISHIGESASNSPKTALSKALLSRGIDIIDLRNAPLPVVHMSTHNATTSGSALVVLRHPTGALSIGAMTSRMWVTSSFWQQVLTLSPHAGNVVGDGRSVKFSLEDEYCERLSSDIALAESRSLLLICDDQATLNLAQKAFNSSLCDLTIKRADRADAVSKIADWLEDSPANAVLLIDSLSSTLTVFDETGRRIRDDHAFMLIIQDVLARQPGADVLFGPTASRLLPSFVTQCGGAAEVAASPPPLMQREMQRSGAIVAGDCRGSVLLKDRWFGSNDPLYNAARMAEVLSNDPRSASELVSALPNTSVNDLTLVDSGELHSTLFDILHDETNFPGSRITKLDGVRLDFADSWVHLEHLKTDGTAQLCFEGDDVDCRSRLEHLLVDVLKTKNPDLALPIA